jgi:hypothetical protein
MCMPVVLITEALHSKIFWRTPGCGILYIDHNHFKIGFSDEDKNLWGIDDSFFKRKFGIVEM